MRKAHTQVDALESERVFIGRDAMDKTDQPALAYAKVEGVREEEQAPAPGEQGSVRPALRNPQSQEELLFTSQHILPRTRHLKARCGQVSWLLVRYGTCFLFPG
jgi:hypothetical protein